MRRRRWWNTEHIQWGAETSDADADADADADDADDSDDDRAQGTNPVCTWTVMTVMTGHVRQGLLGRRGCLRSCWSLGRRGRSLSHHPVRVGYTAEQTLAAGRLDMD